MKNIFLTFAIIVFGFSICNAQVIEMKPNFLGYTFIKDGERLNWKELLSATESNLESYNFIKKAKTNNIVSSVFSFGGGLLIGIPIGQSMGKGDPNWTLALIGGGLVAVSAPFYISAVKNAKKGVDTYNQSLKSSYHSPFNPEFKITAGGNSIGLSINF